MYHLNYVTLLVEDQVESDNLTVLLCVCRLSVMMADRNSD